MADNRRERQDQLQLQVQEAARDLLGPGVASWVVSRFANHLLEQGRRQAIQGAAELGQITRNWIHQNAGHLGQNAWELAQDATTRAVEAFIEPDGFFGPRGAFAQWWDNTAQGAADTVGNALGINNDNNQLANQGPREIVDHPNNERRIRPREDSPPDIGDLIPENTRNVRPRMEPTPAPTEQAARQAGGTSGTSGVSRETPISNYPSLSYGLQETHTTILPWTCWLSVGGLDKTTPAQLKLRMNSIFDMMDVTTNALPAVGTPPTTKGFYNRPFNNDARVVADTDIIYPEDTGVGTDGDERPQWRDFYCQLYEYYTVLGCEYEIILYNPVSQPMTKFFGLAARSTPAPAAPAVTVPIMCGWYNTDIVVATQFDTYTDAAGYTGNHMPLSNYADMRYYKNIQWTPVKGGSKAVIRGTYKPGQAKRNILNDGDAKTWTKIADAQPNFKEILTLNFFNDPFFNAQYIDAFGDATNYNITASGTDMKGCCNMEINLKYIVQFKDLKVQARYPTTVITDQDISITLNESNLVNGSAHHRAQ